MTTKSPRISGERMWMFQLFFSVASEKFSLVKKNSHRHHHSESSILIMLKMAINIYSYKNPIGGSEAASRKQEQSSNFQLKSGCCEPNHHYRRAQNSHQQGQYKPGSDQGHPGVKNCEKGLLLSEKNCRNFPRTSLMKAARIALADEVGNPISHTFTYP